MSNFGKNIKKIRSIKKLSQSAFADIFNLKRASIGAYEEGRSEAKIDTVIEIAKYFSLTIEQLIVKELTVNHITHFDPVKAALKKANNGNNKQEIKLINLANAKNYITNYTDTQFLNSLFTLSLPNISSEMRAFEHGDCEMNFSESGIFKGDILICKKILDLKKDLILNKIYVFVLKNEIITRRLVSTDNEITVKTDNYSFSLKAFNLDEIIECWEVHSLISENIDKIYPLDKRFKTIESKIDQILNKKK